MEFSPNLIYDRQPLLAALGFTILQFARSRRELADRDILDALIALAETYRTLLSGIYYEKPPQAVLANALYEALANFVEDYKKQESARAGFQTLKDAEIFHLLVFLARMARSWTNGRPRARIFLEYLRAQFPEVREAQAEASRIIVPLRLVEKLTGTDHSDARTPLTVVIPRSAARCLRPGHAGTTRNLSFPCALTPRIPRRDSERQY